MAALALTIILSMRFGVDASAQASDSSQRFADALTKITGESADSCDESAPLEIVVFEAANELLTAELNRGGTDTRAAQVRLEVTLKLMVSRSATINANWPEENRFHGEVLNISPALVVNLSIRTQETFFVYGVRGGTKEKPQRDWEQIGEDNEQDTHGAPFSEVAVYPLHRGPSGKPRFLASFTYSGCAGSPGIRYTVEEWDPTAFMSELLTLDGSVGMDEGFDGKGPTAKDPFHPIGKLSTEGKQITLPYCWFSAMDWWDNPNMCAVETYDISGDGVAFVGRQYNRPELASIAKALEYAGKHDLQAVRGYCASEKIARELVRSGSAFHFEDDIAVRRMRDGRERVQDKYTPDSYFEVERRAGGWVITAAHTME